MWVSVKGPIPEETGQAINLQKLDDLVHKHLLSRLDQQDLSRDPALSNIPVTDSSLSAMAWNILVPKLSFPQALIHLSISQKQGTKASTAAS